MPDSAVIQLNSCGFDIICERRHALPASICARAVAADAAVDMSAACFKQPSLGNSFSFHGHHYHFYHAWKPKLLLSFVAYL